VGGYGESATRLFSATYCCGENGNIFFEMVFQLMIARKYENHQLEDYGMGHPGVVADRDIKSSQ
jgi:hypothetical protein